MSKRNECKLPEGERHAPPDTWCTKCGAQLTIVPCRACRANGRDPEGIKRPRCPPRWHHPPPTLDALAELAPAELPAGQRPPQLGEQVADAANPTRRGTFTGWTFDGFALVRGRGAVANTPPVYAIPARQLTTCSTTKSGGTAA